MKESVGVALEGDEVAPLFGQHLALQFLALTVLEETTDSIFARVTEGRIAEVVGQTSCGYNSLNVGLVLLQVGMLLGKFLNCSACNGATYAGYFKAVGQAIVYHLCARQGKHLGLVL